MTLLALVAAGCRSSPRIVVGSKNSTEQLILSEIVAQHLEHRLGMKVDRRLDLGGTPIAYQALQNGEIGIYPEYAGTIVTEILKEQPASDASLIYERARGEMQRVAQAELLKPLGLDNSFVAVIRANDPRAARVSTLSEAAQVSTGWALAASYEFQQLSDGIPALNVYKLPMTAPVRSMEGNLLLKALEQGAVSMIIAHATDGVLTSKDWKVLRDDRNRFVPQQACLLVKRDLIMTQPGLGPALAELSGKFTTEKMQQMNALVDVSHLQPKDVAASFLVQAGLQ
jgi:osmoprotectant transport system substrate-binding protein